MDIKTIVNLVLVGGATILLAWPLLSKGVATVKDMLAKDEPDADDALGVIMGLLDAECRKAAVCPACERDPRLAKIDTARVAVQAVFPEAEQ